jgi:hypothetical protein
MSVHAGEIPMEEIADQLTGYLGSFASIAELYRVWAEQELQEEALRNALTELPTGAAQAIRAKARSSGARSVYDAYNAATYHATHEMRSYRTAFDLLTRINRGFQREFALSAN